MCADLLHRRVDVAPLPAGYRHRGTPRGKGLGDGEVDAGRASEDNGRLAAEIELDVHAHVSLGAPTCPAAPLTGELW
ncbi:hypothetical protein [Streptomyces olivochromogenes]|uniref:hypothetical protein n=1 Tax=Streptomyces olivochromogenes TaxID=1963 RepID=UPI001F3E5234|nr:hypothetical protein [Streptomyces olivochromogenes]MCF3133686.1 hypothetical protein [Streptomyces olivochromogenes]